MRFNEVLGKRIFVRTKSGRQYTGIVQEVHDAGNNLIFISIIDREGKWVTIAGSEVEVLEEEGI